MNPENPYQPPPTLPQNAPANLSYTPAGQPMGPVANNQLPVSASQQSKKKTPWILIILLIVFVLAFIGATVFAYKLNVELVDYKTNFQEKTDAIVNAEKEKTIKLEAEKYNEQSKEPHLKYTGPNTHGSVKFEYPKTWSAMVDEGGTSKVPINGFFHIGIIPGPKSNTAFALRLEVLMEPYNEVMDKYSRDAEKGIVRVKPYKAPLVPEVLGARIDGTIVKGMSGSAVLFPVRQETIRISTYSSESYGKDFDNIILKTLDFTP